MTANGVSFHWLGLYLAIRTRDLKNGGKTKREAYFSQIS